MGVVPDMKDMPVRVFRVVGGEVGGGGPRHEKRAQSGASFVCFMLWEVGVVPEMKNMPVWARFSFVSSSGKEGRGWGCCGLDSY